MKRGMLVAMVLGLLALAPAAHGAATDCSPGACVLLVEVDGLQPEDVTPQGTPFLWLLAHPNGFGANQQGGSDLSAPITQGLMSARNGFMWQAARAPMSASTAASAASLLTGSNPEQHGITADAFAVPGSDGKPQVWRMGTLDEKNVPDGVTAPNILTHLGDPRKSKDTAAPSTLFDIIGGNTERASEAFVGDPALATLLSDQIAQADVKWFPSGPSDGDPRLCGVPRTPPVNPGGGQATAVPAAGHPCPADDAQTLNQAIGGMSGAPKAPAFAYIHLAELGRVKQLSGDPSVATGMDLPTSSLPGQDGSAPVKRALADLDASLAAFVERYANPSGGSLNGAWAHTVLMVVGNHGYEQTLPNNRVPDFDSQNDATRSFGDFVANESDSHKAVFVPQGTVGTVYMPGATSAQLQDLAVKITTKQTCACIDQVLATGAALPKADALLTSHPSWYLLPPTGAGGQLVVTLKPGWAFGRAVSTGVVAVPQAVSGTVPQGPELDNPYLASAGGARDRSVAMLMNGPTGLVRQVNNNWMAVKTSAENPATADGCRSGGQGFSTANNPGKMADDAAATGHECQAETVDIPLSIAALLNVPVRAGQIAAQGRLLKEAIPSLKVGGDPEPPDDKHQDDIVQPDAPPPIIIERNSVQVIPTRKPRDPFPFHGLIQRLRARVVDARGRGLKLARAGAKMTSIEVTADFGKPQSIVRLTFYKQGRKPSGGVARRLVAIARFKPFTIKRGPAKLRLRVPDQFAPAYIGVAVQEVQTVGHAGAASKGSAKTIEKPIGPQGGGITPIADAAWLHRRKGRR